MKRSFHFFLSIVILTILLPATVVFGEAQPTVEVCHVTSEGNFVNGTFPIGHVISIAQAAYDAHFAHGDPVSYGLLSLPNGRDGCSIDSDTDAVPDAIDQCPDQGDLGYGINPDGCPVLPPNLSADSFCVPDYAFPRIMVTNSGGPMPGAAPYSATFEDGTIVSGDFTLGAGESINLDFSNLHGWLESFAVAGYPQLAATVENCLDPVIQTAVLQTFLDIFDPLIDQQTPFVTAQYYDLYYQDVSISTVSATSQSITGGYHTTVVVSDLVIDFFADCTNFLCEIAGGDSSGSVLFSSLVLDVDWVWNQTPQGISISTFSSSASLNGLDIEFDDLWVDFLFDIVLPLIQDNLVADFESAFSQFLPEIIGVHITPLLVE